MEPLEHYARVADGFTQVVDNVSDWTASTPCEEWDARAVVAHVVDTHRRTLARLDDSEPEALGADADVTTAWTSVRADLEKALRDRGDERIPAFFGGEAPFGELVDTLLCADTLLHTWDLARATSQDDTLDLTAVAKAHSFLTPYGEAMRAPGGFGPEVTVPAEASAQERLVAFAGRNPD
ncbi:MAG: hypothetical protein JWO12_3565 [Frankiales bacterium]|nr:hypothetical protein [Frankiales bacterium]